jgi:hypothetical protein
MTAEWAGKVAVACGWLQEVRRFLPTRALNKADRSRKQDLAVGRTCVLDLNSHLTQ